MLAHVKVTSIRYSIEMCDVTCSTLHRSKVYGNCNNFIVQCDEFIICACSLHFS